MPNGAMCLQGGVEQKGAIIPLMATLPSPSSIVNDTALCRMVNRAALQAQDQIKAAVKNRNVPDDTSIDWIITVGPYFIVRSFSPFSEEELDTRGHRPNPSGDAIVAEILDEAYNTAAITPICETLHLIGTTAAASAFKTFLDWEHVV